MRARRIAAGILLAIVPVASWLACSERARTLLATTFAVSVTSSLLALLLGTFLAVSFARTNIVGRAAGPWLLGGMLFAPLYIHIAGWETVLGKFGWWTSVIGDVDSPVLRGMAATIWIHAMAGVPWATLFAAAGLSAVDPAWEETALCELPLSRVLLRITLPAIAPFLALAALWLTAQTAGEMTVTNIYQVRTYAEEIYTNFKLLPSTRELVLSALPGIGVSAGMAAMLLWLVPRLYTAQYRSRLQQPACWSLGSWRWPMSLATWSVVALVALMPLASMIQRSGVEVMHSEQGLHRTWSWTKACSLVAYAPFTNFSEEQSTLAIALGAAAVTLLLVLLPAFWGGLKNKASVAWGLLLPMLIPGPLVGIGVIVLLNRPEDPTGILQRLYDDSLLPPILAVLPRTIPIAGLMLWSAFRITPKDLQDVVLLQTSSRWRQAWQLIWGVHRQVLLAAFLAALAVAGGDLACSILVLPPGVQTIPFRVFEFLHSGCDDRMAALCLWQFMCTAVLGGSIAWLLRKR